MIPRLNIAFRFRDRYTFWCAKHPYLPKRGEFLLNHARSGVVMMLRAALPQGGRVGMMAYNCHTVMNAIEQAGCRPVFIDVDENLHIDLNSLKRHADSLQVLVITHLFGITNDMEAIRKICPNIPIIEDCAHGWGVEMNLVSDAAVYSINQGKFPSIGEGGILKVQSQWQGRIEQQYETLPNYTIGQTIKLYVTMRLKAILYWPLIYQYFTLPYLKKNKDIQHVHQTMVLKKMNMGIQRLLGDRYSRIDEQIALQRQNASQWIKMLEGCPYVNRAFYGENAFMVICHCSDVNAAKQWILQQGFESETHFKHCIEWARAFDYQLGSCPMTENLIKHLLMISTYKL